MKRAIGIVVSGLLAASGCQPYDAVPVQPNAIEVQDMTKTIVGHPLAPNIMLVVDRSGSMTDNASGSVVGACDTTSGGYAGRGPDCKWNNLLDTLIGPAGSTGQGFLAQLDSAFMPNQIAGDPLPLGLAMLPGTSNSTDPTAQACAANSMSILNQIQGNNESNITAALLAIKPAGGTPTAATMSAVGGAFPAPDPSVTVQRSNYIILMTDGAPNCDSSFSATSGNCTGDRCTLGPPATSCPTAAWDTSSCQCYNPSSNSPLVEGCLDEDNTVQTIAQLYMSNIKTFVIGFGAAAIGGSSTETLERMGAAGQGQSTANATINSYYQAASQMDLQNALTAILGVINSNLCTYQLEGAPPNQALIEILVTPSGSPTTTLSQSDFTYTIPDGGLPTVIITNTTVCNAIHESGPTNPYSIEFRYLQPE